MPDKATSIANWVSQVAPSGTAIACGLIGPATAFNTREAAVIARAVPRRRDEFLTGRVLARQALHELGCPPQEILPNKTRAPIWPESFIGSISHCTGMCMAHVARRDSLLGIGVDVEQRQAVTPKILDLISTSEKCASLTTLGAENEIASLIFSAKEAFYKAYFPVTQVPLDFKDVLIEVDLLTRSFEVSLASAAAPDIAGRRSLTGCFAWIDRFVVTAVWAQLPEFKTPGDAN
ncbi:4'-phosphopantetheinyl transferase family protein [Cribrihabitans neustonicus]|uniref:4'-phosphopantetheinyl transferase family protein n=1 Tax=Cribrihabitans neustonicus TaxID=1429085 RepID=UPI003B5A3173